MDGDYTDRIVPMIEPVLSQYPPECQATHSEALGNAGGFSGARLWRVDTPRGRVCVRRWPIEHPSSQQLSWIHDVLSFASSRNCPFLPVPLRARDGQSFVRWSGHFWEITPWMAGVADFHRDPSDEKLRAALRVLARFHLASQTMQAREGVSPGICERLEMAQRFQATAWANCRRQLAQHGGQAFADKCEVILERAPAMIEQLPQLLAPCASQSTLLQPCLRDIWHDHVLFSGAEVSGIIDFGAMRLESVASDIARLLGSLVGGDQDRIQTGLAAYAAVRPLTAWERTAITAFDRANAALAGLHWVRWLLVEQRDFEDSGGVHERLDAIVARLTCGEEK